MTFKGTWVFGNWRTSGDHPNYSIAENGQNTEKSPGDLRRLAVNNNNNNEEEEEENENEDDDVSKYNQFLLISWIGINKCSFIYFPFFDKKSKYFLLCDKIYYLTELIFFGLVWFYDVTTIVGYLMPYPVYTDILNI